MQISAVIKNEGFKLTGAQSVRPTELFYESCNVTHTARRDWASFAVVVLCPVDMLLSVTGAAAFTPKAGFASVRATACCAGLKQVRVEVVGMTDDDDGMPKADIILSGDSFELRGKRAHQLRLSVDVPEAAPAGSYPGTLSFYSHEMFGDEALLCSLDFSVVVHAVTLPDKQKQQFHLDLWQHLGNIARKHETPIYSDSHFRAVERYVKSLADIGQKAVTVIASEIPWSGQRAFNDREYMSDLFEYNMVQVSRRADGSFAYDYSVVDRYVEMCFSYGIDREIEIFGLCNIWMDESKGYGKAAPDWPDGVRIRYFDEATGTYRYMHEYSEIAGYIAALQGYIAGRGWLDRTLVVADEPADIAAYRASLDAIRKAAPLLRFKTAINHAEFIHEFKDVVADYVPVLSAVSAEWDELTRARKEISGRLLYYVCCWPPHPNNFIRSPLAEGRLIPLLAAYLGMDGFLRWDYTVWPDNPRERLVYRTGEWWSGDTCFVYPSRGGEPLLSLRYFALKRGIEDFELARMVMSAPDGRAVLERVWKLIIREPDIRQWEYVDGMDTSVMYSANWEEYEKARALMLEALEQ